MACRARQVQFAQRLQRRHRQAGFLGEFAAHRFLVRFAGVDAAARKGIKPFRRLAPAPDQQERAVVEDGDRHGGKVGDREGCSVMHRPSIACRRRSIERAGEGCRTVRLTSSHFRRHIDAKRIDSGSLKNHVRTLCADRATRTTSRRCSRCSTSRTFRRATTSRRRSRSCSSSPARVATPAPTCPTAARCWCAGG